MLSTWRRVTHRDYGRHDQSALRPLNAALCHLLWPWQCPLCLQPGYRQGPQRICTNCLRSLNSAVVDVYCPGCGSEPDDSSDDGRCGACRSHPSPLQAIAIAGRYNTMLRRAIVKWKFLRSLAIEPVLVNLAARALSRQPWRDEFDAFVPIPQSWTRSLGRGLCWPTQDLASQVARRAGKPVWPVLRARRHRPQVGLSHAQRLTNVRNVFHVPGRIDMRGSRLCLVDDVTTTGATLRAAARALKLAGAAQVWALALAKAWQTGDRPPDRWAQPIYSPRK